MHPLLLLEEMFTGSATIKRHSVAKAGLEIAPATSGRRFRRLFGIARLDARLGARSLAWRCRPDHSRLAGWPGRGLAGLGIRPEVHAAGRRELVLFGRPCRRSRGDVRNLGAAQPERVAGAGLLLL